MTKKKKPFVLRLSPEMMNALEKWAADEFRSVNGQLEWIINRALRESGRFKKDDKGQKAGSGRDDGESPESDKKDH